MAWTDFPVLFCSLSFSPSVISLLIQTGKKAFTGSKDTNRCVPSLNVYSLHIWEGTVPQQVLERRWKSQELSLGEGGQGAAASGPSALRFWAA